MWLDCSSLASRLDDIPLQPNSHEVVCHAKSTAAEVLGPVPVTALTCAHPPPATQGTRWNRVRPESDSTGMSAKGCNVGGAENLSWFGMSSAARCRTPGASAPRPLHAGDRLHVGITMTVPQSFLARSAPLQHPIPSSRCRTSSGVGWVFAKASEQDHIRIGNRSPCASANNLKFGGIANGGSIVQKVHRVTYCIGVMLDKGMIFASDSRTNAGVDNFARFCKMTVFERRGNRVVVLLSSGNLAGTQAVISVLTQRCADGDAATNLLGARTMFDVVRLVSDATRDIEKRDAGYLEENNIRFNASFIVGGQIVGEPIRLFRTYAEGNFIEAGTDTPFFQTGETKYGKPILDRVITQHTPLADATKCVLVSFDSTMRSNLSVGMPIDLICYERDSLEVQWRRRFDEGDPYFTALSDEWGEGVRQVFRHLPELRW